MQDPWGGERPIDDDLLAQLLEDEEQPSLLIPEITFSRATLNISSSPHHNMGCVKSKAQKKKPSNPSNQPAPRAEIPSTSGRERNIPDPSIQTHAQLRNAIQPDVEWYVTPSNRVTIRMIANYIKKYRLPEVTLVQPTKDHRANFPRGAFSAWSRYHIEAGAILPLHPFFQGVANYFEVAPFQITPNGYRMLSALYILYSHK